MELKAEQIILLGIIASVLVQLFKLYKAKAKKTISRPAITAILFVISVVLAFLWFPQLLPELPEVGPTVDPMTMALAVLAFVGKLIVAATAILGFATLIYNWLFEKVFEMLGVGKEKILTLKFRDTDVG